MGAKCAAIVNTNIVSNDQLCYVFSTRLGWKCYSVPDYNLTHHPVISDERDCNEKKTGLTRAVLTSGGWTSSSSFSLSSVDPRFGFSSFWNSVRTIVGDFLLIGWTCWIVYRKGWKGGLVLFSLLYFTKSTSPMFRLWGLVFPLTTA